MKLGCILPILAIGLVAVGGQGLYVGLTNRTPMIMTYQEFLQKKPSTGWIEISDARLNVLAAIHQSNRFTGSIKQAYVPVMSKSAPEDEGQTDSKVHLLLLTTDETILKSVKDVQAATGDGGGLAARLQQRLDAKKKGAAKAEVPEKDAALENMARFMVENRDRLIIDRPVRGLLQFGLDSRSRDRRKIQSLDPDIAEDFAVLEDGAQPQLGSSIFMILAGLGLAALLFGRAGKSTSSTPPTATTPGEPVPPSPGT
jgi:hypothetical protein